MSRIFKINGVTAWIEPTWAISTSLSARSTLSCTVIYPYGQVPTADMTIEVQEDSAILFAGIITAVTPHYLDPDYQYAVEAVDYSALADRRLVSFAAYNATAGDIITDYLMPVLTEEGVSAGTIASGVTISQCIIPLRSISAVLDQLTELSGGYYWTINEDRELDFRARDYLISPTTITDDTKLDGFEYRTDTDDYRNFQYVSGSYAPTAEQTETVTITDDEGNTRYPIAQQPRIYISGVEDTSVGVKGLDNTANWLWAYKSKTIEYNGSGTAPASISVVYIGLYTVFVASRNQAEINRKKTLLPFTSGIRESVVVDSNISDPIQASLYGSALLAKYAKNAETITFSDVNPYVVGTLYTVDKPTYGLNGDYLCTDVKLSRFDADTTLYEVTLSGGNLARKWTDYFRALVSPQKEVAIGQGEIATTIHADSEDTEITGSTSISLIDALFPADDLYPADTLYPGTETGVTVIAG